MKHLPVLLAFLALTTFVLVPFVSASGFYLKTIGALNVEGANYPQYWYTSGSVTLTGNATANESISVSIDGTSGTTTADANGYWSYGATLTEGDHAIVLTPTSSSPYSFTLTISATVPDGVGGITASEIPQAGVAEPTLLLFSSGTALAIAPFIRKYLRK